MPRVAHSGACLRAVAASRTRSGLVNITSAIFAASMPWADSSTICARRQVTTEPVPLTDDPQQSPPLVVIDRARH